MLLQFNFKNFKSFMDDTTLDLTATQISEHEEHIIEMGNEKILPVSVIFGANASGKSNVLEAFNYMGQYVIDSLNYAGDFENKKTKAKFPRPTPFLLNSKTKDSDSTFEVYFIDAHDSNQKTYNYGFSIGSNGVTEEWLNVKAKTSKNPKRIFYRQKDKLELLGIPNKSTENLKIALEKETLVVSLGAKLKIGILRKVFNWFLDTDVVDFGNPEESLNRLSIAPYDFSDNPEVRKRVAEYISSFDPSIVDFYVEQSERDENKFQIYAIHQMKDTYDYVKIPLKDESAGTQKMFALYSNLEDVLLTGGVLFVDELNAKLHPLLVRSFVIHFLNETTNPYHAQLIFTTHDSWQLENGVFRRDEIWFTEKDEKGSSSLFSLVDFIDDKGDKIRKDENYAKNYLLGKYGAIPKLTYMDILGGLEWEKNKEMGNVKLDNQN